MSKIERLVAYTLFLMPVLWAPASSFAQSPFDGTWRIKMDVSKLPPPPPPPPMFFSVNKGMYDCFHCRPNIHVKANGQDQPVTGQYFDTISVREVDPKSIAITFKKNGKTVREETLAVSDDGNTLTWKITRHWENSDQTVSSEITYTRAGKAPAGANGTSGVWSGRINKEKVSEYDLIMTYKSRGDELSMSTPIGLSYTAKLDGKDYPVKGWYQWNSVSLKRVDDRTIEETYKRDGKVVEVNKLTVSPDGKKMTTVETSKLTGGTSTYVAKKQ